MKRILFVHPEGNVNNNPNLSGMVELLCAQGYAVDICSVRKTQHAQKPPCNGCEFILLDRPGYLPRHSSFVPQPGQTEGAAVIEYVQRTFRRYDLIIGVDRGIVDAYLIARIQRCPYGLVSYEIAFEDETSEEFKRSERMACRDLAFAVVPDAVRGAHLSRENGISAELMVYIPVSGYGVRREAKNNDLRNRLGIPSDKRIALFAGSLARWSLSEYLIESASAWDDDWVLVLHNRYGLTPSVQRYVDAARQTDRVYISAQPCETSGELSVLMHGADLGIALYQAIGGSWTDGKNIGCIGLASGKISVYLQHGLPVIVNEIGEFADCVRTCGLGEVIDTARPFRISMNAGQAAVCSEHCYRFFEERFDLTQTISPLLQRIDAAIASKGGRAA